MEIGGDPFENLLSLEDEFYKEGYDVGVADGSHAGLVEGRLFGIEKGFEKYIAMGTLHGRATVWAARLPDENFKQVSHDKHGLEWDVRKGLKNLSMEVTTVKPPTQLEGRVSVPRLQGSARLESHVRTLYALTEPGSLSTQNNEESVSEFDDRLKRAEGKVKVIEKLTEDSRNEQYIGKPLQRVDKKGDDGNIEDISGLHAGQ